MNVLVLETMHHNAHQEGTWKSGKGQDALLQGTR